MRWIAATLLGLLALAYALLSFSSPDLALRPAPDDTGLGGLSELTKALEKTGYRVAFDPAARPRLTKDDVVVVPTLGPHALPRPVLDHVRRGGRAWVLGVPRELQPIGGRLEVFDVLRRRAKVDRTDAVLPKEDDVDATAPVDSWRTDDGSSVATLSQVGKGRVSDLLQGALATNRFVGREQNAKVVFATLGAVARPGDALVFVVGGYGEAEEVGPLEAIGPWAVGALWQSLAVLGAFGIARGIRFGLPAPERIAKRGSRELLDAVAGFYRRGRRTDAPLAAAARAHSGDSALEALARAPKVTEAEARAALVAAETRPKKQR